MSGRYIATSAAGEHVVKVDDRAEAEAYAERLHGAVIDTEEAL